MERTLDDLRAGLRMSQAEIYYRDLLALDAGDTGRFTRMIVDQGKHSGASAEKWVKYILRIASEDYVKVRHGARIDEMLSRLQLANLLESEPTK